MAEEEASAVHSAEPNRTKWWFALGILAITILAMASHRLLTHDGIPIDHDAAEVLYNARHMAIAWKALPASLFSAQPLPAYPSLLGLTARLRHIEPVRAVAGLNGLILMLSLLTAAYAGSLRLRPAAVLRLIVFEWGAFIYSSVRVDPELLATSLLLSGVMLVAGFAPARRRAIFTGVLFAVALAFTSRVAFVAFVVIAPFVSWMSMRVRAQPNRKRSTQWELVAWIAVSLFVASSLWLNSWVRTAPHRYSIAAWRESKSIRVLQLLAPGTPIFTNDPDAVLVLVDRYANRLPAVNDRGTHGWMIVDPTEPLSKPVEGHMPVIVYFTADDALPAPEDVLRPYLPPGDWIDLPDATLFAAHDDPAVREALAKVHKEGFRLDSAWTPSRRSAGKDKAWLKRHDEFCAIAAKGDIGLLFLGDSITDDVRQEDKVPGGTAFFNERFAKYKPANFGIDHDRTEHLLFRILNGECPSSISPKVAVILIGTNNAGEDSPEAIARGVRACVDATRKQLPQTKILLMGEFPRSAHADSEKRAILKKVNALISKFDDGKTIRYLDIYDRFLTPSGDLSTEIMYDLLHPTLKGYHIWYDAMQPLLDEMMK